LPMNIAKSRMRYATQNPKIKKNKCGGQFM